MMGTGILAAATPTSCIGGDTAYARVPKLECDCTAPDGQGAEAPAVSGTTTTSGISSGSVSSTTPLLYTLISVVEHSGNHSGGHYTVYRKDAANKWFHISDEKVTPIEDVRMANAYLLFYEKI